MEYKVSEVKSFSEQVYGKFNNHRIVFKVEGNDNLLSAFGKVPFAVGQVLTGEIIQTQKDGKTYHNFEFARKTSQDNTEVLNAIMGVKLQLNTMEGKIDRLAGTKKAYPVNTDEPPFPDEF